MQTAHEDQDDPSAKVSLCVEYPEDPRTYLPEGEQKNTCVSVWRTDFIKVFEEALGMSRIQFEQGALGSMTKRPTCCLTNLVLGIHGMKDPRGYVDQEAQRETSRFGRMGPGWLLRTPYMSGKEKQGSRRCVRR